MNIGHWVVNKHWKRNTVHVMIPLSLCWYAIWRHTMLTTVILYIIIY